MNFVKDYFEEHITKNYLHLAGREVILDQDQLLVNSPGRVLVSKTIVLDPNNDG